MLVISLVLAFSVLIQSKHDAVKSRVFSIKNSIVGLSKIHITKPNLTAFIHVLGVIATALILYSGIPIMPLNFEIETVYSSFGLFLLIMIILRLSLVFVLIMTLSILLYRTGSFLRSRNPQQLVQFNSSLIILLKALFVIAVLDLMTVYLLEVSEQYWYMDSILTVMMTIIIYPLVTNWLIMIANKTTEYIKKLMKIP